jgi:hypothetical protein
MSKFSTKEKGSVVACLVAYVHAPIHSAYECVFKEGRKPPSRCFASFHALQFRPHSPNLTGYARYGGRRYRSRMDLARNLGLMRKEGR